MLLLLITEWVISVENINRLKKTPPPEDYLVEYTQALIDLGFLTLEPIRKYPLKKTSYNNILKLYAHNSKKPYKHKLYQFDNVTIDNYYLTDAGIEWMYNTFESMTPQYRLTLMPEYFNMKGNYVRGNPMLNNLIGTYGINPKSMYSREAILVRRYGKNNKIVKEYHYPTSKEAREAVLEYLKYYPIEQFELYVIKNGYRVKKPLLIDRSGCEKRALNMRLAKERKHSND